MSVAVPQEVPTAMTIVERERTNVESDHQALTRAELRDALEQRTMAEFGLPLDEFVTRLRAGELEADSVEVTDIAALARLLSITESGNGHGRAAGDRRRRSFLSRLLG